MAQTVKLIRTFKTADYAVMQMKNEYVAGWCPRIKLSEEECRDPESYDEGLKLNMYWSQGHYFQHGIDALIFATRKEIAAKRRELDRLEADLDSLENALGKIESEVS